MNKNQKGFGLIEGVLVLVIFGIIGGAVWYVVSSNKDANKSYDKTASNQYAGGTSSGTKAKASLKQFNSDKAGLGFKYPSSWDVNEDLSKEDPRGDGYTGTITVKAPSGLTLHISPNYGGKGGACEQKPSDTAGNTEECSTLEVVSRKKADIKSDTTGEEDVYLITAKHTGARENGKAPKPEYQAYLTNNTTEISATEPLIDAWFALGIISNMNKPNIDTFIDGVNLSSAEILDDADFNAAKDILLSLNYQ